MKRNFLIVVLIILAIIKIEAQTSTFSRIDSLVQFGRYKNALSELEKMPSSFLSNKKMASIYDAIDNPKKASYFYEKALQFKDDYTTKIKLGASYRKQKKFAKAIKVFEEITAKDLDNLFIQYQLGKLYLQTKQSKKAETIFKNLIRKDIENANYSYQLGLVYKQLKKRNLKINSFLKAYRKDTLHFKSIEKLARNFTKLRFRDSALIFIDKGLQLNSNHFDLNRLKINDLYRKKEYKKAISLLKHINSLRKNEHYTHKMLGKSYFNIKDYENAKIHFKKSASLDKDDYKSHTYLGDIFMIENNLKAAMFQYSFATLKGKEPRDIEHLGLAKVYEKMLLPKRVLGQYKKAVEENPKNREALYLLAKQSDNYYKDKTVGYKLYKNYLNRFEGKDKKADEYILNRIKTIKKEEFLKGRALK